MGTSTSRPARARARCSTRCRKAALRGTGVVQGPVSPRSAACGPGVEALGGKRRNPHAPLEGASREVTADTHTERGARGVWRASGRSSPRLVFASVPVCVKCLCGIVWAAVGGTLALAESGRLCAVGLWPMCGRGNVRCSHLFALQLADERQIGQSKDERSARHDTSPHTITKQKHTTPLTSRATPSPLRTCHEHGPLIHSQLVFKLQATD